MEKVPEADRLNEEKHAPTINHKVIEVHYPKHIDQVSPLRYHLDIYFQQTNYQIINIHLIFLNKIIIII